MVGHLQFLKLIEMDKRTLKEFNMNNPGIPVCRQAGIPGKINGVGKKAHSRPFKKEHKLHAPLNTN